MDFNYGTVDLNLIDTDDLFFRISTNALTSSLLISVKQVGILNPPIIISKSDGYRVVSGWRRIEACRQLGFDIIPVRLLDTSVDREGCIKLAICDNTFQRELNLVEQARAVRLISTIYHESEKIIELANALGLSINQDMLDKLMKLTQMDITIQSGLIDGSISLSVALSLYGMNDQKDALLIGLLLRELGLGLNRQREILDWMISICRWDGISAQKLLKEATIEQCRQNDQYDRRQKGQIIRDYLKKRRFPTIVQYENNFAQILRKLKLANGTHLIAPQHFESPSYTLKIDFKNRQELQKKCKEIDKMSQKNEIESLWRSF